MFNADPKTLSRIDPLVRRVLIVDPQLASARLLQELIKGMGAREIIIEPDERRALQIAAQLEPALVFVERSGPALSGESFARRLRRSNLACRQVPIIMVTAEATAAGIKGARDAGVHEVMVKPFTAGDLLKRVMAVTLKSRDWIEAVEYVGPDRRRFNSAEFAGQRKRKSDKPASRSEAQAQAIDQAVRIVQAALDQFDRDPQQALRALKHQTQTLKTLAVASGEARTAVALAGLDRALTAAQPTRASLVAPVEAVLALYPRPEAKAA